MASLCRDCGHLCDQNVQACPKCGGARLVRHPALSQLNIAHLDCDAFFAAIEKRDDPNIRDKPVIVGGGRRGVVATCCYIARLYGVRSAMPMFKALRACPNAVVVPPNFAKYSAAAKLVRAKMDALTPLVEPVSID
ncbi:MAG: DNA polymerase IV, partial [Pseudomonadota bacterium]